MSITVTNELQLYKTKVGLFAQEFGKHSKLGDGGYLEPGSHVFLDQILDGWGIFRIMLKEKSSQFYVQVPVEHVADEMEECHDEQGVIRIVEKVSE